jgi:hypothetical protein
MFLLHNKDFFSHLSCTFHVIILVFVFTFSKIYEKWVTYIRVDNPHLCVFMWSWTYEGDPPSTPCHELIVTLLHDPNDPTSSLLKSFSFLATDCDGVLGSSSS